ncbi:MAG: hypothetical protein M1296_02360 [Chloroflexi bacterium]|nr:hypothetical protein [Chloroflexota bacterium]
MNANPLFPWHTWRYNLAGKLPDYPSSDVSDGTFTVTTDVYPCTGQSGPHCSGYDGAAVWVFNKNVPFVVTSRETACILRSPGCSATTSTARASCTVQSQLSRSRL